MKLVAALTVSIAVLAAQSERAQTHAVTAIRHWSLSETTRIAIEVSGEFKYRSDRLHTPERVYFDILNARPRIDSRRFFSETVNDKIIQKIRAAETTPGITRVVIDLTGPVEISTSQLTNPNRLVVELRPGAPLTIPTETPVASPTLTPAPITKPELVAPPVKAPAPIKADMPEQTVTAEPSKSQLAANTVKPLPKSELPAAITTAPATPPATTASRSTQPAPEVGKPARRAADGQTSLVRALGLKLNRVVIDPGHGGHDEGTHGVRGLLEKDLVLDVALRLGKLIQDRMGAEVVYTRNDDTFIPLQRRTEIANESKADLFLSIHANSSPVPRIAGVESYYLNFTESKEGLELAARENATSQKSVFDLHDIIQKITLHDKAEESKDFAGRIQTSLYAFSARNFPTEKNRGVKKAPFVVLIGANMPSVLAEVGFLSNTREETLLKRSDYRDKLAEALYRGISKYADSLSHFQMAEVQ